MEQEVVKVLMDLGAIGAVIIIGVKYGSQALKKLYEDIQVQHKEQLQICKAREDKLMEWIDKKNETDHKIAETLDNICNEMGCLSRKVEDIERKVIIR